MVGPYLGRSGAVGLSGAGGRSGLGRRGARTERTQTAFRVMTLALWLADRDTTTGSRASAGHVAWRSAVEAGAVASSGAAREPNEPKTSFRVTILAFWLADRDTTTGGRASAGHMAWRSAVEAARWPPPARRENRTNPRDPPESVGQRFGWQITARRPTAVSSAVRRRGASGKAGGAASPARRENRTNPRDPPESVGCAGNRTNPRDDLNQWVSLLIDGSRRDGRQPRLGRSAFWPANPGATARSRASAGQAP
jgi:hypothetical protein